MIRQVTKKEADGFQPRRPDYRLRLKTRSGEQRSGLVGAAWTSDNGCISIKLDPGVRLGWDDNLYITLVPADNDDAPF